MPYQTKILLKFIGQTFSGTTILKNLLSIFDANGANLDANTIFMTGAIDNGLCTGWDLPLRTVAARQGRCRIFLIQLRPCVDNPMWVLWHTQFWQLTRRTLRLWVMLGEFLKMYSRHSGIIRNWVCHNTHIRLSTHALSSIRDINRNRLWYSVSLETMVWD